jgi:arsenite methyltransferase
MNPLNIIETVQNKYGEVARSQLGNDQQAVRNVAAAFGYTPEDLASLPPESNMGLSCGNPVAVAALRPGEVVLDLGCGGGLDVLLAAKQVGPTGKAIGVDMTPDMLIRARAGAAQVGATNVEFHLAEIDRLPLADNSVDCILSNCVINLVPDKSTVFREMLRVLKPGGRIAISDIALHQPLPPEVAADIEAYVGCIAGALLITEYQQLLSAAGFESVVVTDTGADLNAYAEVAGGEGCCSPASACCASLTTSSSTELHSDISQLLQQFDVNAYAASVRVHALKSS